MEDSNSYRDLLKKHNLSLTSLRMAVLEALKTHPHSDADQIFNVIITKIPSTSKQAIYQNLKALTEQAIIREIKPKGRSSLYETRVNDNHHHLVCRKCNAVEDTDCFDYAPCLEPMHDHGFAIDEAEVIFWGLCSDCQNNNSKKGNYHGSSCRKEVK